MRATVSQITGVSIACANVCSGADQRKHQIPCHWPLKGESTGDKGSVTRMVFPFDDVITIQPSIPKQFEQRFACPREGKGTPFKAKYGHTIYRICWIKFPLLRYSPHFSASPKHTFAIEDHSNIWRVSPRLNYSYSYDIWIWLKI